MTFDSKVLMTLLCDVDVTCTHRMCPAHSQHISCSPVINMIKLV
ncbi:unnamed protein product [Ixodes persulcatus]